MAEMKENQKEVETAMVALGVVLLIAGVKHGLTTLVEQWRALVFLLLNLLLLSILFTSIRFNSTKAKTSNTSTNTEKKEKGKKNVESKRCSSSTWPVQVEDLFKIEETVPMLPHEDERNDIVVVDSDDIDEPEVSKEELNARVESFIMMFRQQLALDAKERRQAFSSVASNGSSM
ncbi:hypothetical protein IFM89_000713 [Coptis chinensis]|uniref:Uncharacterized protein n=1 Tax=Coptis chinensis TaxID=261450 RepID=A0A835IT99_9MAGN|nr:hypothetical protein IFM89_000713 [Coptis chinensis]